MDVHTDCGVIPKAHASSGGVAVRSYFAILHHKSAVSAIVVVDRIIGAAADPYIFDSDVVGSDDDLAIMDAKVLYGSAISGNSH